MAQKIRYPRTTLEVCDATLDVLRNGIGVGFSSRYPELTCYNGRQWKREVTNLSIYYVRTSFTAWFLDLEKMSGMQGFDVRLVIIRTSQESTNSGFPFFWCSAWYKTGQITYASKPPEAYRPEIHRGYYHCPRWSDSKSDIVSEYDPAYHFPDLEMIRADKPPHPINF